MDVNSQSSPHKVVRVSLAWLLIGFLAVVVLGMAGGMAAVRLWLPPASPLTAGGKEQLISNIQEITISPSTAAAEVVKSSHPSVVLISAESAGSQASALAAGFVITNDGLVVTAGRLPGVSLAAYDYRGQPVPLELIGEDKLFGLTYFRTGDSVFVPLDLRSGSVPVAHELIALTRSSDALLPRAEFFRVQELSLPAPNAADAVQQVFNGAPLTKNVLAGTPLLDEEGRVAGIVTDAAAGLALPVTHLKASLDRITSGQRELDPFASLGFELGYTFANQARSVEESFAVQVLAVEAGSPAAKAGLKKGDLLMRINGKPFDWETPAVKRLAGEFPLTVTLNRDGAEAQVTLNN